MLPAYYENFSVYFPNTDISITAKIIQFQKLFVFILQKLYFFIKKNCDVYITGSNAFLLSGELATLLSGRYIEIKMLPLSFKEFLSAHPAGSSMGRLYQDYIHNSSFPYALELRRPKDIRQYLEGIYDSIVLKDIIARRRIHDLEMLKSVTRFLFDNIGNLCSTKKIADTFPLIKPYIENIFLTSFTSSILQAAFSAICSSVYSGFAFTI